MRNPSRPGESEIGVTARTIRIAVIADVDNPARPGLFSGSVDGVRAFAKFVNAHGGVAGRRVQVDFTDSHLSADETHNALIKACQEDFAIVGRPRCSSTTSSRWSAVSTRAAAAREADVDVETAIFDVTDAAAAAEIVDRYRPYAVVNNAGYSITGAIEDVTDGEALAALETMVIAPMRLARLTIPHMRERGEGRIVNVSSIYGRVTTPLTGWYQGAKHALEALTDALRIEVAGSGIRVVLVEPGGFRTGIWEEAEREVQKRAGSRYDGAYRRTLQGTRLAQPIMGAPGQVAKVIAGVLSGFTRPRYLVGYDAAAISLRSRLTPTEIKDRLSRLVLGL